MPHTVIAVADSPFPTLDPARAALAGLDYELRMAQSPAAADILAVAHDADALLVTYARIDRGVIAGLKKCRAIGRFGLGVDNIDLAAARDRGIAVNYVPDYCIAEVSDHTMALLLALVRKVPMSDRLVQVGRWEMPAVVPIHRLRGRTLGLIGFGNIPRAVAPKAKAFGLNVISHDPFVAPRLLAEASVEGVSLDQLLATSDIVSVHAPLTPATRGLLGAEALAKTKNGCLIINTARGPLIEEAALVAALDSGQVGGAALDVVTSEPLPRDSRLLGRDNVILTPHTGFYSIEALEELQSKCAGDVARVLTGKPAVYPVRAA